MKVGGEGAEMQMKPQNVENSLPEAEAIPEYPEEEFFPQTDEQLDQE